MFNKSRFLIKRLLPSPTIKTTLPPFKYRQLPFFPPHYTTKSFQTFSNSLFSSFSNLRQDKYKEDLALLKDLPQEELASLHKLFDKYAASQNRQAFSPKEITLIISVLQRLSAASQEQGDVDQASLYLSEAEEVCKKFNIKNTIEAANGHFMIADYYLDADRNLDKVEKHLDEAERICSLLDDVKEVRLLKIYVDFDRALLYAKRSENDKALKLFNKVLKKTDGIEGKTLSETLWATYREMSLIYILKKDHGKTEEYSLKNLKIATEHFGEYSQQAFEMTSILFLLYSHTQNHQDALYYCKKSLQIALKIFSKESVEVAICYSNLGELYLINRKMSKALEATEEAIKIYEKLPKKDYKALSALYCLASNLHHLQGETQEAHVLFMKSNEMLALINVENDPKTINTYLKRAAELKCLERWDEAKDYLKKALKICQGSNSLYKLRIVEIHFSLCEVFYAKKDWNTALQHFEETEKLLQEGSAKSFAPYSLDSYLGVLYIIIKDYAKGFYYLEKAGECCEMAGDLGFLLNIYYFLGRIYERRGMKSKREETKKKFGEHRDNPRREDPSVQASLKKSSKIFCIIDSLDKANTL